MLGLSAPSQRESRPDAPPSARWASRCGAQRPDKRAARLARGILPRGLLGRTLLIALLPLVALQAIALQLFYGNHLDVISRRLTAGLAGDVAFVAHLLEAAGEERRGLILREGNWRLGLALSFEPGARLEAPPQPRPAWSALLPLERDLEEALRERTPLPFDADWLSDPSAIVIRVQLEHGVLSVEAPRKRLFSTTLVVFVLWLVGSSLLLGLVALLFLKNQVRAIRRLAGAAEAFGLGRDTGPIKPEGAREVRQAAQAFNAMQRRILRFVAQRTELLAGISHDLRTPLTRMQLQLAMLPRAPETAADVAALAQDVEEMGRLIESYLAFARGEGTEQAGPADLAALLRDEAAKARRSGADITLRAPPMLVARLREGALRRALGNLLDNARRHAARIELGLDAREEDGRAWAEITVDDDGPGIAAEAREAAFRPFASGSATGTGLGLAIARDILRAHGGEITLEASPLGGLRARLRLPL